MKDSWHAAFSYGHETQNNTDAKSACSLIDTQVKV